MKNQFIKIYKQIDAKEKGLEMLPPSLRKEILKLTAKFTGKSETELLESSGDNNVYAKLQKAF